MWLVCEIFLKPNSEHNTKDGPSMASLWQCGGINVNLIEIKSFDDIRTVRRPNRDENTMYGLEIYIFIFINNINIYYIYLIHIY